MTYDSATLNDKYTLLIKDCLSYNILVDNVCINSNVLHINTY